MKVLIVSDIHGNFNNMKKVLENNPTFDKLLILGDILAGDNTSLELSSLLNIYKDKIIAVKGNNDWDCSSLDFDVSKIYITLEIDKKIIFLTHGHVYNRSNLPEVEFDVFIGGHRHIPMMEEVSSKIYLNPGSITLPRGGSDKSYIFYEDGVFYLKNIDNRIIKKITLLK